MVKNIAPRPSTRLSSRRHRAASITLFVAIALGACAADRATRGSGAGEPPAADAAPRWIALFNGLDLAGWTPKFSGHPLGENYKNTFRVEDGELRVAYDGYDDFGGAFGHLFYRTPYSHYRLRLEYRFTGEPTPGAPGWAYRNNGVMIHGQTPETMRLDQDFPVSVEVQLLGGDGTHERHTGNICTPGTHVVMNGELIKRHCIDSSSATFHGDQWVTLEIEVRGDELIRHMINGVPVIEYTQPQLDEGDGDARRLIEQRGGERRLEGGTISLQAEGHAGAFRNIDLLPLTR